VKRDFSSSFSSLTSSSFSYSFRKICNTFSLTSLSSLWRKLIYFRRRPFSFWSSSTKKRWKLWRRWWSRGKMVWLWNWVQKCQRSRSHTERKLVGMGCIICVPLASLFFLYYFLITAASQPRSLRGEASRTCRHTLVQHANGRREAEVAAIAYVALI